MPKRVAEDDSDGARDPPEAKSSRRMVKVSGRFRRSLAAPSSSQAPSPFAGITSNTASSAAGNTNPFLVTASSSGISSTTPAKKNRREDRAPDDSGRSPVGLTFGSSEASQASSPFAGIQFNRPLSGSVFQPSAGTSGQTTSGNSNPFSPASQARSSSAWTKSNPTPSGLVSWGSSAGNSNRLSLGAASDAPSQSERNTNEKAESTDTAPSKGMFLFGSSPAPQASPFSGFKPNSKSSDALSSDTKKSDLVGTSSGIPSQTEKNSGEEVTSSSTSNVGFTFGKAPTPQASSLFTGITSNPSPAAESGSSAGSTNPSSLGAIASGIFNPSRAERSREKEGASADTGPSKVGFTFGSALASQAPSPFSGTKSNPSSFGAASSGTAVLSEAHESNRPAEPASSNSASKTVFSFGSAQASQVVSPSARIKPNPSSHFILGSSSTNNDPDSGGTTSRAEKNKGEKASSGIAGSMDGPFPGSRSATELSSPSAGMKCNSLSSGISDPSAAEKGKAKAKSFGTAPSKVGFSFGSSVAPVSKDPDAITPSASGALSISSQSAAVDTTASELVGSAKHGSLSDEVNSPSEAPFGDGLTAIQGVRLNKMFLSWISHQFTTAPEASFDAGNRDYVAHAAEIKRRVVFSRSETVSEVGSAFKHPPPTTSSASPSASPSKPSPVLNTAPLAVAGATPSLTLAAPAPAPKPVPTPAVSATSVVPEKSIPPAAPSGNSMPSLAAPAPTTTSGFSPFVFGGSSTSAATDSGAFSNNSPPSSTTSFGGGFNFSSGGLTSSSFQGKFNGFKVPSGGASPPLGSSGGATDEVEEAGMPKEDPAKLERAPGEEDEEVVRHFRAKLYLFKKEENVWGDLGVGILRLMKHKSGGSRRLILRNDMGKVLLNVALCKGMNVNRQKNTINFMANIAEGGLKTVMLKVTPDQIADLHASVVELLPSI